MCLNMFICIFLYVLCISICAVVLAKASRNSDGEKRSKWKWDTGITVSQVDVLIALYCSLIGLLASSLHSEMPVLRLAYLLEIL